MPPSKSIVSRQFAFCRYVPYSCFLPCLLSCLFSMGTGRKQLLRPESLIWGEVCPLCCPLLAFFSPRLFPASSYTFCRVPPASLLSSYGQKLSLTKHGSAARHTPGPAGHVPGPVCHQSKPAYHYLLGVGTAVECFVYLLARKKSLRVLRTRYVWGRPTRLTELPGPTQVLGSYRDPGCVLLCHLPVCCALLLSRGEASCDAHSSQ